MLFGSLSRRTAAVPAAESRFDSSFYNTHGAIGHVGYIPPDAQSVVSQVFGGGTGMSKNGQANPFMPPHLVAGRRGAGNGVNGMSGPYSSYATSIISQKPYDAQSIAGSIAPSVTSTQYDRLHRQGNGTQSGGTTDGGYGFNGSRSGMGSSIAGSEYSYKTGDNDAMTNYTPSQAGVTEY